MKEDSGLLQESCGLSHWVRGMLVKEMRITEVQNKGKI